MARRWSSYKKWVLVHFEINFDFKSTHEFKIDFKSMKSTLISKHSSCTFWNYANSILKATWIIRRWIILTPSSQCLTLELCRGFEYYHLKWSSCHAYRLSEKPLRPQKNLLRWEVHQPWVCLWHQLFMHTCTFRSLCHKEGKEDQLDELHLEIQHHNWVSGYASG